MKKSRVRGVVSGTPRLEVAGLGKVETGYLEVGILCSRFGDRIWLSQVRPGWKGDGDPELEAKWLDFLG